MGGNKPLVSVIISAYNVAPFLEEYIQSVLHQTYDNLEIILIDDGSNDQSGKICTEYAADNRINVIHKNNAGVSAARNTGIEASHGDYLCFVDGDDFVIPERDNANSAMTKFLIQKCECGLKALEIIKQNLAFHSLRIENAWKFANWRTHSDFFDMMSVG